MVVMLCTRCQQREARPGLPPDKRAEIEAEFGGPVPFFREGLCEECWSEWFREWVKTPEAKAEMDRIRDGLLAKWRRDMERLEHDARSAALKVLDVADAIAGRF